MPSCARSRGHPRLRIGCAGKPHLRGPSDPHQVLPHNDNGPGEFFEGVMLQERLDGGEHRHRGRLSGLNTTMPACEPGG